MYEKKYISLKGDVTGIVKYEKYEGSARINIRIDGFMADVLRASLFSERTGERLPLGIINESGQLSREVKGSDFDAVLLTRRKDAREELSAWGYMGHEYDLSIVLNLAEEKNDKAEAAKIEPIQEIGSDPAVVIKTEEIIDDAEGIEDESPGLSSREKEEFSAEPDNEQAAEATEAAKEAIVFRIASTAGSTAVKDDFLTSLNAKMDYKFSMVPKAELPKRLSDSILEEFPEVYAAEHENGFLMAVPGKIEDKVPFDSLLHTFFIKFSEEVGAFVCGFDKTGAPFLP